MKQIINHDVVSTKQMEVKNISHELTIIEEALRHEAPPSRDTASLEAQLDNIQVCFYYLYTNVLSINYSNKLNCITFN